MPDYRPTVCVPRSPLPMRANLARLEPEILAAWQKANLFDQQRRQAQGRPKFILHDGPPYANGHLHMGHALNKILKDLICRAHQMLGFDAHYVPGWDCHGLPIEWRVEEDLRAQGLRKEDLPVVDFRAHCRRFAEKWIAVQAREFQRLGVNGNWHRPYTTMSYDAEAAIVHEIGKFLLSGDLKRGQRPVLWSVPEHTALADAEVEYQDRESLTLWVAFPVRETRQPELLGSSIVIWTTTPWTLPGNRAVAYAPTADYLLIEVESVAADSLPLIGQRFVVAAPRLRALCAQAQITCRQLASFPGTALAGTQLAHPLSLSGYSCDRPLLPADFVMLDQGSGFVHIAPGHGSDDFELGRRHELEIPEILTADGRLAAGLPLFGGLQVLDAKGKDGAADEMITQALIAADRVVVRNRLVHSYPHSWRSKAPLLFRITPQWFIAMEGLRAKALAAIAATRFVPPAGQKRLHDMIASRPDWCISRQRLWGVPLPLFWRRADGQLLKDPEVIARIAETFAQEGADAWFTKPAAFFLGKDYAAEDYEQCQDIVEVWFDSGSTHSFVLEARAELKWPADLYLEGSDQHRGWFHSSLLESCGTRGRAPYEAVLTHGFVLDQNGHKMSKSLGNAVSPAEVVETQGADVLRWWVASCAVHDDVRIGPDILRQTVESYRRIRNTLRYLLGALEGYDVDVRTAAPLSPKEQPELERLILHRLHEIDGQLRRAVADFDFMTICHRLHAWCAQELSAFYFEIRKDCLYCDHQDAPARLALRRVLAEVFRALACWLAPILPYTCEEVWRLGPSARISDARISDARASEARDPEARDPEARDPEADAPEAGDSAGVHLELFPKIPATWRDEALAARWQDLGRWRRFAYLALEQARAAGKIGSFLQAHLCLFENPARPQAAGPQAAGDGASAVFALSPEALAELMITSSAQAMHAAIPQEAYQDPDYPGWGAQVLAARGKKCARCWKILPEVTEDLCRRCSAVIACAPTPSSPSSPSSPPPPPPAI